MGIATRYLFTGGLTLPALTGPYLASEPHGSTILTQIHCHTDQVDGEHTPAEVVDFYLDKGYGALAITDHDVVTSQPAGITSAIVGNELNWTGDQHVISLDSSYTSASNDAQELIDGILASGGQAELAHPNWADFDLTLAEMQALTDYMGIEIHNEAITMGLGAGATTSDGFAVPEWDALLADRLVWGFAVDDLHVIHSGLTYDVGRLRVFVGTNTPANIMAALVAGRFVADVTNYGVTPGYPQRSHRGVVLDCPGATRIEAYGIGGALLASASGTTLEYPYDAGIGYCRLVAIGQHVEPFTSALSDRWQTRAGTWATSGGILEGTSGGVHLVLQREGDFTAEVDARISSGGTAGFIFNARVNGTWFYLVQISGSVLTLSRVEGASVVSLASVGATHTASSWYTVKLDYSNGIMRAKSWLRSGSEPADWMLTHTDTTWTNGAFGLRGDGTPAFDDLVIDGLRTYYQPIPV